MNVQRKLSMPIIPNYLKVGSEMVSITELSDDELREFGKEFIQTLIDRKYEKMGFIPYNK